MVSEGLEGVQMAVSQAHAEMDTGMPSMVEVMPKPWPTPPTYFKLNAFTIAFQVGKHRIVLHRIALHRIALHRIALYRIVLHRNRTSIEHQT